MATTIRVTVGIDLGGTSIRVGLFDTSMTLLSSRSMPTRVSAGPRSVVEEMAEAVAALLAERPDGDAPEAVGIGIGSPGPIDLRRGVLGKLPNFPGWDNFP